MSWYDNVFLQPPEARKPPSFKEKEDEPDEYDEVQQDCDYWQSNCYGRG